MTLMGLSGYAAWTIELRNLANPIRVDLKPDLLGMAPLKA
jgi:hypothetical protein